MIRTDNGPELAGRTTEAWAAKNGAELRFIQPGKPVQNAYSESFNGRFHDECLSQHWLASLALESMLGACRRLVDRGREH